MSDNNEEIIDSEFTEIKDGTTITTDLIIEDKYENVNVITDLIFDGKENATLKDLEYMCNFISSHQGCEYCFLCPNNPSRVCAFMGMIKRGGGDIESLNSNIIAWLTENPPTSYLMDIRDKMPNVVIDSHYHIPNFCVKNIYGNDCCECNLKDTNKFSTEKIECRECWRKPMD